MKVRRRRILTEIFKKKSFDDLNMNSTVDNLENLLSLEIIHRNNEPKFKNDSPFSSFIKQNYNADSKQTFSNSKNCFCTSNHIDSKKCRRFSVNSQNSYSKSKASNCGVSYENNSVSDTNPNPNLEFRNLISSWDKWSDQSRLLFMRQFIVHLKVSEINFLTSILRPYSSQLCYCYYDNSLDALPDHLQLSILSRLDPISLVHVSRVCKSWHQLTKQTRLWLNLCRRNIWRVSSSLECKQMLSHSRNDGTLDWKSIFIERYLLWKNWFYGRYKINTFECETQGISCVCYNDKWIVAGCSDGKILVWNLFDDDIMKTKTAVTLIGHSGAVRCLVLDGNNLISGSVDRYLKVWNLRSGLDWNSIICRQTFKGHSHTVRCLQKHKDIVVSGSYDETIKIWDYNSCVCKATLCGHTGPVLSIHYDGNFLISGSLDKTIRLWDLKNYSCTNIFYGHDDAITCIQLSHGTLISGSIDSTIRIWDLAINKCIKVFDSPNDDNHDGVIRCLMLDHTKMISGGDDKTIKIRDLQTGNNIATLRNHADGVTCLQFDDCTIVSGSYDKSVRLWDFTINISTGQSIFKHKRNESSNHVYTI